MTSPVLQQLRALTLYHEVPPDCGSLAVLDDAFAPHLNAGEWAIFDNDDGEPVSGEIYVVKISSVHEPDGYALRIVQLRCQEYQFAVPDGAGGRQAQPDIGWMMHFQIIKPQPTPKFYATPDDAVRNVSSWTLCDGPLLTEGMRGYIVGRVVGFMLPGTVRPDGTSKALRPPRAERD